MKCLYSIIFLLPIALFGYNMDVQKISKQMDRLKDYRKVVLTLDYNVYDPFATAKPILKQKKYNKVKKHYKRSIKLQTILNNRVLIKNRWYGVGDSISGYKIIKIEEKKGILLYKDGKSKQVLFKKKKDFIHITKEIVQ